MTLCAFEKVENGGAAPDVAYPLALAVMQQGKPERAIEILVPFLRDDPASITFRGAADMLIDAYRAAGRNAEGDVLLARLSSLATTVPLLAPIVAEEQSRRGMPDDAIHILDAAVNATEDPEERAFINRQAADLLARQKRFAEAAKKYDEVLAFAPDLDASRRRIIALYNAGDIGGALRAAQALRGDGPAVPRVSEIEAQILWQARNSVEAEKMFRLLAQAEPQRKVHLIRAIGARADYERADALEEVRRLTLDAFNDAETLMEAALLRERLGLPDILEWYYQAVAVSPEDEDVILSFIGAYTRRRGAGDAKDPTEVTSDCAVTLRRGEDKRLIVIAPEPDRVARAEYFASDSPFAQRLHGRREGDAVGLTVDDEERGRLYTIEIITSRYALASYQLMSIFPVRFPESNAIRMGEGEEELLANIDHRDAYYRDVLALYERGVISLNAAADRLNTSVVQLWGSVVADRERPLRAAVGSSEEVELVASAMRSAGVVVDVTAALTLEYLGLSNVAFAAFQKVYIPRRAVDELEQLLLNEFTSEDEPLVMGKENEQYVARERTAAERRMGRQTTERLLDRLQRAGDVMPNTSLIELGRDEVEKLLRRAGEVSLAAALVAKQEGAALLSDDVVTRVVAFSKWRVPSANTQDVLLHLKQRTLLSSDDYLLALGKLSDIGYRFMCVGADDLFSILKRDAFSLTLAVQRLFRILEGPDCNDESSVRITAELLVRLYSEPVLPANIAVVAEFLCRSHAAGRDAVASMKILKNISSAALRSRPRARAEVSDTCDRPRLPSCKPKATARRNIKKEFDEPPYRRGKTRPRRCAPRNAKRSGLG